MKALALILALVAGGALGFLPQEPPEYPAGMFCTPLGDYVPGKGRTTDHPCHCKNMGDPQTSCEKPTTNDPVCRQFCHEQHCSCPLACESH